MIKQDKNIDINLGNLEKIYKEDPNNISNIINLANAYIASGNFIQALKFTKLASKSSPKNLGIDFTLSNLIDYNNISNKYNRIYFHLILEI